MARFHTSTRTLLLALPLTALLAGCVSSARYRIRDRVPVKPPPAYENVIREEKSQDDLRVDPDAVLPAVEHATTEMDFDRSTLVRAISGLLGTPYNYSGTGEDGIDCSGFTARVFRVLGKDLPHSTAGQYQLSSLVGKGKEKVGDLVFFNTTGESPSHVGIYLGGGYFAHASVSSGVTISSLESSYYKSRYLNTRRLK